MRRWIFLVPALAAASAWGAFERPSENERLRALGNHYRDVILQRSCKVLVHKTAHMFGLPHCTYYECVINGSNSMTETDAQPQHLCPVCLRKLHHAVGFDAVKRYGELARFYRGQKRFEESDWVQRQLARASKAGL